METHSLIHSRLVGSGVGWPRVNLDQFPRYQYARGWAYTVNAGDTLYIPAYWWHWVRSEGSPAVAVNVWTARPHHNIFEAGCNPSDTVHECGRVPTLFPQAAAAWVAKEKWTLAHIRRQYFQARATRAANGEESVANGGVPELLGTCVAGDAIYPEFWGSRVMDASPLHVRGAPPKPKTFDDFADVISNSSVGDVCHLHIPLEHMPAGMVNDFPAPQGMRPPSASAADAVSTNLWVTGGSLQSGLHYDSHYNSLTVLSGTKTIFLFPPTETKHLYKVGNVGKANSKGTSAHGGVTPPAAAAHPKAAVAVGQWQGQGQEPGPGPGQELGKLSTTLVQQGNDLARARDFRAAKKLFATELSGGEPAQLPALLKHLSRGNSWPAPMIGLFAASYQLQVVEGTASPASQWPATNDEKIIRVEASRRFSAGVLGAWYAPTAKQRVALDLLPPMGETQLYGYSNTVPLNPAVRSRDMPIVIAAGDHLDYWRDLVAANWSASRFAGMSEISVPVGTVPYGDLVQESFRHVKKCSLEDDAEGRCWGVTPELASMSEYVAAVMARTGPTSSAGCVNACCVTRSGRVVQATGPNNLCCADEFGFVV